MNKQQFLKLHFNLTLQIEKSREINREPSATDPTQDIPIKMIEVTTMGVPINVKQYSQVYNNLKAENFTTIELRHNDQFDQLGELQESISSLQNKDITTTFVKPKKQQKKHEN